ncbi:MAG: DUF2927 domain-containing protein [Oscillospiraceae bacterium]|nr:DUF2927 domain-containing protein [Oscillospiraceae bacterium]
MRKGRYLGLGLALVLLLCACAGVNSERSDTALPTYEIPTTEVAIDDTTAAATVDIPETMPEETETTAPVHSALYLPEYAIQQVLEYFEEVVLHMEYTVGPGDATLVQKWKEPIHYHIYGNSTQEDLLVLTALFAQLNEIPGFPGIYAAADGEQENLTIRFLDSKNFNIEFSALLNGEDAYGAAQFWYYTATNEIYTANVGYRTDIDQSTRTSVLIEEIINMLGVSDTVLRTDSIVYQYSNDNTALSEIDWLILKLLYDPAIQCGMDVDGCRTVIQELYY